MPFQKIMHVLEVAATMDRRDAAFPEKEGKPWTKYMCCNFWFLLLLLGALFCFLLRGRCDCSHFLTLLCPRAEWSTDGEWRGTWHCHSQCMGQKVKELTSHQILPLSGKHDGVAANVWEMRAKVMVDLFVGLQKDDPGKMRCLCVAPAKAEDHLHQERWDRVASCSWLFGWKKHKYPLWYLTSELMKMHIHWYGCHGNT